MLSPILDNVYRAFSRIFGNKHPMNRVSFAISDQTNRCIEDLIEQTNMPDRTEIVRNFLRLHSPMVEDTLKGYRFYVESEDGSLEPFEIPGGPSNELQEDRGIALNLLISDRAKNKMFAVSKMNQCRDPNDFLAHAMTTFKKAVEITNSRKIMVRELPDGTIEEYPLFENN